MTPINATHATTNELGKDVELFVSYIHAMVRFKDSQ
jgi:hypothetical protein